MSSKITTSLSRIQELDRELVALLQKRFQLARELALTKKISGLPVMDREGERRDRQCAQDEFGPS